MKSPRPASRSSSTRLTSGLNARTAYDQDQRLDKRVSRLAMYFWSMAIATLLQPQQAGLAHLRSDLPMLLLERSL